MYEKYAIMTAQFRNVLDNGSLSGFQLLIRTPYYRGIYLSTVDSLEITVDGETFPRDKVSIALAGQRFTMDQMEHASKVRWPFGDPATVMVVKPGGLIPGMHNIRLSIGIRKSYFPKTDPEGLFGFAEILGGLGPEPPQIFTKTMTLVQ